MQYVCCSLLDTTLIALRCCISCCWWCCWNIGFFRYLHRQSIMWPRWIWSFDLVPGCVCPRLTKSLFSSTWTRRGIVKSGSDIIIGCWPKCSREGDASLAFSVVSCGGCSRCNANSVTWHGFTWSGRVIWHSVEWYQHSSTHTTHCNCSSNDYTNDASETPSWNSSVYAIIVRVFPM